MHYEVYNEVDSLTVECFKQLGQAVIEQACFDYQNLLLMKEGKRKNKRRKFYDLKEDEKLPSHIIDERIKEEREFFLSGAFDAWAQGSMDGARILEILETKAAQGIY